MGKVKTDWMVQQLSGKPTQESDTHTRTNRQTGVVSTVKILHPYDGGHSEAQLEYRAKFKALSSAIKTWQKEGHIAADQYLKDPSPLSQEEQLHAMKFIELYAKFRQQHECGTFYGYLMKKQADGKSRAESLGLINL